MASAIGIVAPKQHIPARTKARFTLCAPKPDPPPSPSTAPPSSNRHSNPPLLTASAQPAVSSPEAWTTPALHVASRARPYSCTGRHRPTLNGCGVERPLFVGLSPSWGAGQDESGSEVLTPFRPPAPIRTGSSRRPRSVSCSACPDPSRFTPAAESVLDGDATGRGQQRRADWRQRG